MPLQRAAEARQRMMRGEAQENNFSLAHPGEFVLYSLSEIMTHLTTLADRFALLLQMLLQATGNECPKRRHLLTWPLALGIGKRIRSFALRFTALVARWRAGKLRPPGPPRRRAAPERAVQPRPPDLHVLPASLLPRAFAWLHRIFPESAPPVAGMLDSMLRSEPGLAEFVAAVPQAGRIPPREHVVRPQP